MQHHLDEVYTGAYPNMHLSQTERAQNIAVSYQVLAGGS